MTRTRKEYRTNNILEIKIGRVDPLGNRKVRVIKVVLYVTVIY